MRRTTAVLVALVAAAPGLAACSGDGSGSGPASGTSGSGTSIHVTVKDGRVTPNGDRVKAEVDEPITVHIDADTSGEIHVHSTPEQEIAFDKGTSTKRLTIRQPGIVDVEDHALDQVIVQLEVR
jgi:hypothetical protein